MDDGVMLLHPTKLNEATTHPYALVVVMAAVCLAVDEHGNLMRMAIATPRNDFRLARGVQGRQVRAVSRTPR